MPKARFKTSSLYYWLCQIGGWGFLLPVAIIAVSIRFNVPSTGRIFALNFSGLLATHLLRIVLLKYGWLKLPPKKALTRLLPAVVLASAIAGWMETLGIKWLVGIAPQAIPLPQFVLSKIMEYILLITPWTLIYCFYNYIGKTRIESMEKRKLELRLKEMEEQAGESEVDVDFLIDSLRRIQSSIGDNPNRSRAEITEFSNLLRRGFLTPE